jgi:hypothetical protein
MRPTGKWGYLPSRPGQLYTWALAFEPRDWWIGLYRDPDRARIFVCIVPCLPLVIARLKVPGPAA